MLASNRGLSYLDNRYCRTSTPDKLKFTILFMFVKEGGNGL